METSIVGFVGSSTTARETDACICGHGVTAHNIKRSTGDMLAVCVILLPFILLQFYSSTSVCGFSCCDIK